MKHILITVEDEDHQPLLSGLDTMEQEGELNHAFEIQTFDNVKPRDVAVEMRLIQAFVNGETPDIIMDDFDGGKSSLANAVNHYIKKRLGSFS